MSTSNSSKEQNKKKYREEKSFEREGIDQKIVDTLHEPLLVLYPNLKVKLANPAFYNEFKVNENETVNKPIYELGNGQWDIPALHQLLEDVLPENKMFNNFEVTHHFEHIGKKVMLINARQLDHESLILLGIRDISVQKEYETKLLKAREKAEEYSKLKDEFLSHLSHEIRTPLNSVMGLSYLLLEKPHNKEQKINLNYLKSASENLNKLLNDILDYVKVKANHSQLYPEKTDLRKFTEDTAGVHQPVAERKGIKLDVDIDDNLPQYIKVDSSKLLHVLQNLIGNAVKFTPQGKIAVKVKMLDRYNSDVRIQFSVTDTGIGIKKKQVNQIFDEFKQVNQSTTKQIGGTGLGLSIAKLYLELMNSELKVESEYGKGSRFWFVLQATEWKKPKPHSTPPKKKNAKEKFENARILIVEDDNFSRMMLSQMLTMWGIKHDEATNGKEAIQLAKKHRYDIIYMDIHMPKMDGIEATKKIKNIDRNKKTPVYTLTADITDGITDQIKNGLFSGKTIKPFAPDKLLNNIKEILSTNNPDEK